MTVLLTGAAGFIGLHAGSALLDRGDRVVGVDNVNAYYDPALKLARLDRLLPRNGFAFEKLDIADRAAMEELARRYPTIDRIVHLGAQAGVRHSLKAPHDYLSANLAGHLNVLELARHLRGLKHLVYASSSSVYGANSKLPFAVEDRTDRPVSLYGATKMADELMTQAYSHLYRIKATGLRFFTVYGPWGRPDMSPYIFTSKIIAGEPIPVFNHGDMRRDFTYVDDAVAGILGCLDRPPVDGRDAETAPHRIYNIGNSRSEALLDFIAATEKATGRKAVIDLQPMQPGDVKETYADISAARRDFGFAPKTPIGEGMARFVAWYRAYHRV
ncbi:MAG: NAD-dependent epimerase/dehydratase family protein [Alphaproteobacteria bacterium]|nr:NAD-dependent epimerase/dehydratase family protein [Alphaproteobacteria bacterium]